MAQISKFRINTHYTALKQLPTTYSASFSIGGSYGYGLGVMLGSSTIEVPPGVYVETPLIRCTLDGNVNHLSPELPIVIGTEGTVYISITHIASNRYELKALFNNTGSSTITIPSSTVEAKLRIATAPF